MAKLVKEVMFQLETLDREDLSPEEASDLNLASLALKEAYCPYSHFSVGAVIRTNDNRVFKGWNVENIVYTVLHAEANAMGHISKDSRETGIKRLTVVGTPEGQESEEPVTPCGDCRQNILELVREEDKPMIIMAGVRGKVIRCAFKVLLPLAFYPGVLAKK